MNKHRPLMRLILNSSAPNAHPLLKIVVQQFRNYASAVTQLEAEFLAAFFEPEPLADDSYLARWLKGIRGRALTAK